MTYHDHHLGSTPEEARKSMDRYLAKMAAGKKGPWPDIDYDPAAGDDANPD